MKKVFQVIAVVLVASAMLTACGSAHYCPAYGKVHKPASERPA